MIKPKPSRYKCNACKWSKIVVPTSDALQPGDHYSSCPKCGSKDLSQAGVGSIVAAVCNFIKTDL